MNRFDLLIWFNVSIIIFGILTNSWIITTPAIVIFILTINLEHVAKYHKEVESK